MSEIKHEIEYFNRECANGEQIEGYLINDDHTIADIARWLIKHKWDEDLMYLLNNREDL